jgi:hypothetical protein
VSEPDFELRIIGTYMILASDKCLFGVELISRLKNIYYFSSVRALQHDGRHSRTYYSTVQCCAVYHSLFPTYHVSRSYHHNCLILQQALKAYEKCTKKDLLAHLFVALCQACNSPDVIISIINTPRSSPGDLIGPGAMIGSRQCGLTPR